MKLYLEPRFNKKDRADGGIRRVIEAQIRYLPEFGIELVDSPALADLTAGHIDHAPIAKGKPFVSHNHGLYWSEYGFGEWGDGVNASVVAAMLKAQAITAPSKWVAYALTYGMLRTPRVIYHGVDASEWRHDYANGGYVLWNKARADAVSNPAEMNKVAALLPGVSFVTTIGRIATNVKVIGTQVYAQHKKVIQQAAVYLATARETFGIGTLEAMASGVPVAGWDIGGQSEIIIPGETGYLAPYGDYAALADCITKCLDERGRLGENARKDVETRWQWRDKIEQYANLYKQTLADWNAPRPKVSVIVTAHNLAKYLPDALNSVAAQSTLDWECLIVDDDSRDATPQIGAQFAEQDKRFRYLRTPENLKLSRALNYGHTNARGRYVMNLDADNILPENTLAVLSDALDERRDLAIVYGGLDTIDEDGTNRKPNAFPYPVFSWYEQMAHRNQLHSSAMMRREVTEQSGGYRERQWRAEDAEFWCRVSSFGFRIERVTDKPTLVYRWRSDSKSFQERRAYADIDGDWCEFFPWRTAASAKDGENVVRANPRAVANTHLVPFGAQGKRTDARFWNVSHHQSPLVSVIIPCILAHRRYLPDALDSLVGQLMGEWEAIVVNDAPEPMEQIPGAPYARIVSTGGNKGAGAARNAGLKAARAPLVFFLDADDMLEPDALLKMIARYKLGDAGYVYCGVKLPDSPTTARAVIPPEYDRARIFESGIHSMAMLMATEDARTLGFDEEMIACEDWDFWSRCAINGICGVLVPEPLVIYRKHLGVRSALGQVHKKELYAELRSKYAVYANGGKAMGSCCGGKKTAVAAINQSKAMNVRVEAIDSPVPDGYVRMRYVGAYQAPVTYHANGREYKAANTPKWNILNVLKEDVYALTLTNVFKEIPAKKTLPQVVAAPVAPEPKSMPIPATVTVAQAVTQVVEVLPNGDVIGNDMPQAVAVEAVVPTPKRERKRKQKGHAE